MVARHFACSVPEYRRNSYVLPFLIQGASAKSPAPLAKSFSSPPSTETYTSPHEPSPVLHPICVAPNPALAGTGLGLAVSIASPLLVTFVLASNVLCSVPAYKRKSYSLPFSI